MTDVKTVFGALRNYQKGGVEVIRDDPKHYGFSNVFEVAEKASKDRWHGHKSYLRVGPERTEELRTMVPKNWAEMSGDEKADWLGLQEWDHLTVHEKLDWLRLSFAEWIETANRSARAFMIIQANLHNSIVKLEQELQKVDRKLQQLSDQQN